MIVTIDGPAGSGKSSAAKALARRLGFEFLDTGAMYRAVALAARRAGVPFEEGPMHALLSGLRLEMPPGGAVLLDGQDVSGEIRTAEVTSGSSEVAVLPGVRGALAALQRSIAEGRNMVCEGRDQGTVVFPDAGCKFFLVADPQERARRRQAELAQRGTAVDLAVLLDEMDIRDRRDSEREVAPLRPAPDAILIDTTHLTLEQVVEVLEKEVRRRSGL